MGYPRNAARRRRSRWPRTCGHPACEVRDWQQLRSPRVRPVQRDHLATQLHLDAFAQKRKIVGMARMLVPTITYSLPFTSWRRAWRAATTLDDLAACTIGWLTGEAPATPGYAGWPDPETQEIVDDLRTLNRAGLVTVQSQPQGSRPIARKRAWVELVGAADQIADLADACTTAGLHASTGRFADQAKQNQRRAHRRTGIPITQTRRAGWWRTLTTAGWPITQDEAWPGWRFQATMQHTLNQAASLTVIDPQWPRNRHLWDTLTTAARR